jgi:hypothetical protein
MTLRGENEVRWGLVLAVLGCEAIARGQATRQIRLWIDLLKQSVSETLHVTADPRWRDFSSTMPKGS